MTKLTHTVQLLVLSAALLLPTRAQAQGVAPDPAGLLFGAWVGERVNVPGDVAAFEQAIGRKLSIVHRYSDNPPYHGAQFDAAWADEVANTGALPMLSWQPGFGHGTRSLAEVAAGDRDEYITTWADQIAGWGRPLLLRPMWEQNATWYAWRAVQEPQVSQFITAWQRIVDIFRARGASNVAFVWSPNVSGQGAGEILPTFPGDDYVDWVALDGYPFRGGRGDFVDTFGADYDLLLAHTARPIMIAETSLESWSDEQKATRIRDLFSNVLPTRFARLKALVWFDEKNTSGADFSILQDQGPLSRAAFVEALGTPTANPPPTLAENSLLVDPGFETGASDADLDPAWVVPSWLTRIVHRDRATAAAGSYSLVNSSQGGESYTVYQDVPVIAGATYDVAAQLSVDDALGFGKATLDVQSLNTWGGTLDTTSLATWREPTAGWVPIGGSVRVARDATHARLLIRVTALRGRFHLDEFSFQRRAA